MFRRLTAVSALVLAGLALSPAARAEGFFSSFFETSPRDVVEQLYEQGYSVRLPMIRRGDVYVVDAMSSSRRRVRLIVSTHDGHVMQRYATTQASEDRPHVSRWRDAEADRGPINSDEPRWERRTRTALGDPSDAAPRLRNRHSDFEPTSAPPSDEADRPKHHARRPAPVARDVPDNLPKSDAPVAAVAPSDTKPVKSETPSPARVIEAPQAKAPNPEPSPSPTSQVKIEDRPAPRVIPLTKSSPIPDAKVEEAPKPAPTTTQAKAEDKPAPKPIPKPAPSAQAKVEEKPAALKPEAPRKKLNDLPVGTLD